MRWHAVISGLVGGSLATWLTKRAVSRLSAPSIDAEGWHWLKANGTVRLTLVAAVAVALLCAGVLATGSYRTEERGQTISLVLLTAGFAIGAAVLWWQGFARTVRWRGDILRTGRMGTERDYTLSSLRAVDILEHRYEFRLHFAQGTVTVSMLLTGMHGLMERLYNLRPDLFPVDDG